MPLRRRLGLCILMAGSLFSMVACVMRIVTAHQSNLYQTSMGMLWAGLEQCLVIILGSAPTLPPLRQIELGVFRSLGVSLASLVDLRSHWRRGRGSSGRDGSASLRSSGDEKTRADIVVCQSGPPNQNVVNVQATQGAHSSKRQNLFDSFERMPDEQEEERPLHGAAVIGSFSAGSRNVRAVKGAHLANHRSLFDSYERGPEEDEPRHLGHLPHQEV